MSANYLQRELPHLAPYRFEADHRGPGVRNTLGVLAKNDIASILLDELVDRGTSYCVVATSSAVGPRLNTSSS